MEAKNKSGKIVLLIFLLICSGLGIAAFTMSFRRCNKDGFLNDNQSNDNQSNDNQSNDNQSNDNQSNDNQSINTIIYRDINGIGYAKLVKYENEPIVKIIIPKNSMSKTFSSNINKKGINYKSIGHSEELIKSASHKIKTMGHIYPNDYEGPALIFIFETNKENYMIQGILKDIQFKDDEYVFIFTCLEKPDVIPENIPHEKPSYSNPHVHATAHPGQVKELGVSQLANQIGTNTWSLQLYGGTEDDSGEMTDLH